MGEEPLIGINKLAEGPHGFPSAVDLPAEVVVNYDVQGACTFTIDIRHDDSKQALAANLSLDVTGLPISGAWNVKLEPGSYVVVAGEAVGCTFSIAVYAA